MARGPILAVAPVGRFRPRVLKPATSPPPDVEVDINALSLNSVSAFGNPTVGSDVASEGVVSSIWVRSPVSRFRPRIERRAHYQALLGQTVFASPLDSASAFGSATVTEEFSLDGGGSLPEGVTIAATSLVSDGGFEWPTVTDSGATILATSLNSVTIFGAPAVWTGDQIRTSSLDSEAAIGEPAVTVVETTILASSLASASAFGGPVVDDGIGSWLGPAGSSSSRTRGNRRYLVQFKGRHLYFDTEREAQEFIEWRTAQDEAEKPKPRPKKRKPLKVVNLEPEPPRPLTPAELAEQARKAEIDAIKAQYEAQMADMKRQAEAEIAFLTASAGVLKQDNEALRMLIEA